MLAIHHVDDLEVAELAAHARDVAEHPAQRVGGMDRLRHQDAAATALGGQPGAHPDRARPLEPGRLREDDLALFRSTKWTNWMFRRSSLCRKSGASTVDPQMMTKILMYAYCEGVFSSRKMQDD